MVFRLWCYAHVICFTVNVLYSTFYTKMPSAKCLSVKTNTSSNAITPFNVSVHCCPYVHAARNLNYLAETKYFVLYTTKRYLCAQKMRWTSSKLFIHYLYYGPFNIVVYFSSFATQKYVYFGCIKQEVLFIWSDLLFFWKTINFLNTNTEVLIFNIVIKKFTWFYT